MALRRPNPKGARTLRTISAARPGPDAQRHLLPVRDIELIRKPQARRYRYSRSGALTYAPVRRGRGIGQPASRRARASPRLRLLVTELAFGSTHGWRAGGRPERVFQPVSARLTFAETEVSRGNSPPFS